MNPIVMHIFEAQVSLARASQCLLANDAQAAESYLSSSKGHTDEAWRLVREAAQIQEYQRRIEQMKPFSMELPKESHP